VGGPVAPTASDGEFYKNFRSSKTVATDAIACHSGDFYFRLASADSCRQRQRDQEGCVYHIVNSYCTCTPCSLAPQKILSTFLFCITRSINRAIFVHHETTVRKMNRPTQTQGLQKGKQNKSKTQ